VWDLPEQGVPIAVAVSGDQSVETFAPLADHLVAVEPEAELVRKWDTAHGGTSRKIGQLPVCWGPDRDAAVRTAHEQFRWFAGGWKVNAELPGPAGFAGATQFVRPEDVAENIPCGPDLDAIVAAVREFEEAGFTDVALVQIGDAGQEDFLRVAEQELLPALRG
jgi:G6PDH family F420-dependent oxidoreductase